MRVNNGSLSSPKGPSSLVAAFMADSVYLPVLCDDTCPIVFRRGEPPNPDPNGALRMYCRLMMGKLEPRFRHADSYPSRSRCSLGERHMGTNRAGMTTS